MTDVEPDYDARNALVEAVVKSGPELPPDCRLVLFVYSRYVNQPHGLNLVWMGRTKLKNESGLTSRRAQRAMDTLVESGWFVHVEGGTGTRAARYSIKLPGPSDHDVEIASSVCSDHHGEIAGQAASDLVSSLAISPTSSSDLGGEMRTQEHKKLPPAPQTELERLGVPREDWWRVLEISQALGARSPSARLAASPEHRADVAAEYHRRRAAQVAAADAAGPRCAECGRPQRACDAEIRPGSRVPVEARCRRHDPQTSPNGRPSAVTGAA